MTQTCRKMIVYASRLTATTKELASTCQANSMMSVENYTDTPKLLQHQIQRTAALIDFSLKSGTN